MRKFAAGRLRLFPLPDSMYSKLGDGEYPVECGDLTATVVDGSVVIFDAIDGMDAPLVSYSPKSDNLHFTFTGQVVHDVPLYFDVDVDADATFVIQCDKHTYNLKGPVKHATLEEEAAYRRRQWQYKYAELMRQSSFRNEELINMLIDDAPDETCKRMAIHQRNLRDAWVSGDATACKAASNYRSLVMAEISTQSTYSQQHL